MEIRTLFHYTSLDTLALILTNRTLCFNNLCHVDDIEEAETSDMANFGKYVYVSCWTSDPHESIALWGLYTSNMHGVRIELPCYPFKKHVYHKGQYYFNERVETYINMDKLYDDNKASIVANQPELVKVEYTDDEKMIIPQIRSFNGQGSIDLYLNAKNISEVGNFGVMYSFDNLGKYKRKVWEFQNEWRYTISVMPMGLKEMYPQSFKKHQEIIRRIENPNTPSPYERFFLELDENAISQMRVVFGPRMSEAEKIFAKLLLKEHGLQNNYRESALKIR
ncbi:MAG: DUF2971 domain-containing protein [Clostridia bacterium]|nr:DUF2971 domain-containing protein [Clostridia bacterium]